MKDWLTTPLEHLHFVALDIETTGLRFQEGHRICEIGLVRFAPSGRVGQLSLLVNPEREVPQEAFDIHGIDDESLKFAPKFEEIIELLFKFIGDFPIFVYNANFDLGFLNYQLKLNGMDPIENPVVDVLEVARRLNVLGTPRGYRLAAVARSLGISFSQKKGHRALYDAYITGEIFRRLGPDLERAQIRTLEGLMTWLGEDRHRVFRMITAFTDAILANELLRIRYRTMHHEVAWRVVRPIEIEHRNNEYFLRAYDMDRDDERVFRLRQIQSWQRYDPANVADAG